ncbi:hypothetical protein IAR55_001434 [Kwoniella newhampshirensis]|uniref:Striatin N-terminal domain-containing protein n=1 Tax=Kwoniella newhampshirensis TaxID=1651941 RepID=A0AAW0Z258_9TREE
MLRGYVNQGYPPQGYAQQQQQQPLAQSSPQFQQRDLQSVQQQQQQQHQQQQGGGPQSVNGTADGGSGSASAPGQEMNLASVLHYLQSEWRRWERDRNEWEIERAEMRARIALLEGQRRSAENLKVDLLRRVKMLEFALRQERTKTVSTGNRPAGIPPARLTALQDEEKSTRDDKEGSGSEGSQEDPSEKPPKMNGIHPAAMGKSSTVAFRQQQPDSTAWKNIGSAPRDPKSRARSREYLKQCLQEITYLTSPGALNPLPSRPPIDPPYPPIDLNLSDPQASTSAEPQDRPRKSVPEQVIPSMFPHPRSDDTKDIASDQGLPNGVVKTEQMLASSSTLVAEPKASSPPSAPPAMLKPESYAMAVETTARPPSSPAPRVLGLPETNESGEVANGIDDPSKQILTAIYRPDSKTAWREELRAANEMAEKAKDNRGTKSSDQSYEDQLASLTLPSSAEEEEVGKTDEAIDKVWTSRRSLKSHLDIVRAIAFAHGPGVLLATGGDDCTVKVWAMDTSSIISQKSNATESEPIITFRGHTAAVTAIEISSILSTIFSASLDSTIRLWRLPAHNHDPYATYDPSFTLQTLIGHTDAVWDICLLPHRDNQVDGGATQKRKGSSGNVNGPTANEGRLVSASADGTIKLWESKPSGSGWSLEGSWSDFGEGVVPTCLSIFNLDFGKVLVGLSDGSVRLFDLDEGKEVQVFGTNTSEDGEGSQVNAILSHPTLPAIITAHEDGHIRFYDAKSTSHAPTHTILAHPAPVTSLSISPLSPTCILTSSTDCTVRLWDLGKKTSIQDLSGHRGRNGEGVCAVASHPELPVVGTAGADGVVRLWGAG